MRQNPVKVFHIESISTLFHRSLKYMKLLFSFHFSRTCIYRCTSSFTQACIA